MDHDEFIQGLPYIVWRKVRLASYLPTCDTCHDTAYRESVHATATAHNNRQIDSTCGLCHTSDTSVLGQPGTGTLITQADVDTLHRSDCTLCHNYTGTEPDGVIITQAIQDGLNGNQVSCLTCHINFDAIHAFLVNHTSLVTVGSTYCGNCHSVPPLLINPADPMMHSACTNCHDAEYNTISLAEGKSFSIGGDCTTCHGADFSTVHPSAPDHTAIVKVASTRCAGCHNDPPPLVDEFNDRVHNACSSCHDENGGLIDLAAGKSFSQGGDCTTCHGDYFTSHTHHNGAENDVSYNAAVDIAQGVQQGCEVCHHDYDTLNITSIGLSTWETILVEHDLDGTKDGSTNTCENCHAYDGNGSPPLETVQNAITSGNSATCATCHTEIMENVNHYIPTSGKHPQHLALPDVTCETCHDTTFYPFFKSGTDLNGDNRYNLTETDVCDACHKASW